ncbi:hypothetical protein Taro_040158 [Colocasia esculenta]|uniref:Uncharacterized protein n=1 Tax=Colocasia esculenta TaxID=4460 RepID=A0A843WID0_COLES|nr:hypothetical protein [Colocasia esculenta]
MNASAVGVAFWLPPLGSTSACAPHVAHGVELADIWSGKATTGRFGVSMEFSSRFRRENVTRSGGNAAPCMDCAFFAEPSVVVRRLFRNVSLVGYPRFFVSQARVFVVLEVCPGVVFVGLHCSLACVAVERQLDLTSVTARLRVPPVVVCHGVGTVIVVVGERKLTSCGLTGCGVP